MQVRESIPLASALLEGCPPGHFLYTAPLLKSLRSTIVLLLLNATWLAVLSYYLAKRFGNQPGEARIQYVTNYVTIIESDPDLTVTNTVAVTNDFRWAQLESEDYRAYVARLRSMAALNRPFAIS